MKKKYGLTPMGVLEDCHPLKMLVRAAFKGSDTHSGAVMISAISRTTEAFRRKELAKHATVAKDLISIRALVKPEFLTMLEDAIASAQQEAHGAAPVPEAPCDTPPGPRPPRRPPAGAHDEVADALSGLTLDEMYEHAARGLGSTVEELRSRYGHLNKGMQRMNLGNRLRSKK